MLLLISNRRSTMLKTMAGIRARCIDGGRTRRDAVRSLVSISGVVVVRQRLEREQAALFGIFGRACRTTSIAKAKATNLRRKRTGIGTRPKCAGTPIVVRSAVGRRASLRKCQATRVRDRRWHVVRQPPSATQVPFLKVACARRVRSSVASSSVEILRPRPNSFR